MQTMDRIMILQNSKFKEKWEERSSQQGKRDVQAKRVDCARTVGGIGRAWLVLMSILAFCKAKHGGGIGSADGGQDKGAAYAGSAPVEVSFIEAAWDFDNKQ